MDKRRGRHQEGQILVLASLVMAFLFVPLAVFVIDTGLVELASGHLLQRASRP